MPKRVGLGKGLDALIPGGEEFSLEKEKDQVGIDKIKPNPHQPRKKFDPQELIELSNSIKEHGILQPLIVTSETGSGEYILIAGERRLEAARTAGLKKVPVIVREASELQRLELALIENVQREDLDPLEEAQAYAQLADEFNLSHEEIAGKVGRNRATITNRLRLLKLPGEVKKALTDGKISEGHARALLGLSSADAQLALLKTTINRDLNVRQVEELVRKINGQSTKKTPSSRINPEAQAMEQKLQSSLGTRVKMQAGKKSGSITIYYYSEEELEALLERLLNE
ncbi:MAG: ParB/RepB/Spo0J family partition protein [Anaerolineales bacterium]